jgi:hypothetical protein
MLGFPGGGGVGEPEQEQKFMRSEPASIHWLTADDKLPWRISYFKQVFLSSLLYKE